MTTEEWKKVDKALKSVFSPGATLLIDGYKVTFALMQKSQFTNAITVYINGEFKLKWLTEDCEERRRFLCCKRKTIIKEKDYKIHGIRSKKARQELADKYSYNEYYPYWCNFAKLKKHLIQNNENIELVNA